MGNSSRVESIFFAALERAGSERAVYLDSACAGDADLRRQVEKLLKAHPKVGNFLQKPAVDRVPKALAELDATVDFDPAGRPARDDPGLARTEGEGSVDDHGHVLDFLQPSTRADSLGRLGHYEILQMLGHGAFGVVFRAFDDALQRVVAVKVLSPRLALTSPPRKRFLREARSSARIRHENIVQVYAVEEQPLPYLVMEYIPGETLQQRIDRTGPLDADEVALIGRQIAEGLAAAHAQGLIHRDIKPANILIESEARACVKITDFGLARAVDDASMSQSGIIAGTPMFMSPEQVHGGRLDHRADLFSLGSVLYTMCTGHPPFRADSTLAVLKRVADHTPRPISEITPEAPQWLCDLITRLHAKSPDDRIATARDVADLLAAGEAGRATPRPQPGSSDTPPPRSSGSRWIVAAVGLMMLIAGFGFAESSGVTNVRGTIIRLFSPEGTLVIEVDDPGISVQVDGADLVIRGAGAQEIRLKPGKYTVVARKDGKLVRRELVTVANNGRQVVRVSQEPPESAQQSSATADWEQSVAALPAAEQVTALTVRLKELNPGFDGALTPTIEGPAVIGLRFSADQVTDISPLRAMTRLRSLDCSGSDLGLGKLTDLSPLSRLPLTTLACRYSPITDLAPLKNLVLTALDCRHTDVGDADVKHLAGMTTLQLLSLWGTRVTDAGVKELAGLKNLQYLSLENTQVSDASLKHLAGMQDLRTLSLYHALNLTDGGVMELAALKGLKTVELRSTRISEAAVRKLAAAHPALTIHWVGGTIEPMAETAPGPDN